MADDMWSLLMRNTILPVDSLHTLNLRKTKISSQKIAATKKTDFTKSKVYVPVTEVSVIFGSNQLIYISVSII